MLSVKYVICYAWALSRSRTNRRPCTEAKKGVFSPAWSKAKATVGCTAAKGALDFKLLEALDQ